MKKRLEVKRIVAATDFSDCATTALSYATRIALRLSSELTLLHATAVFPTVEPLPFSGDSGARAIAQHQNLAVSALEKYRLTHVPDLVKSDVVVFSGEPANAIVAVGMGTDLIVMGTRGHGGLKRALLGSVAERVIRDSERPVLSVREGTAASRELRRIVCPINYTGLARRAFDYALLFASAFEAELIVLYLIDESDTDTQREAEVERLRAWMGDVPQSVRLKLLVGEGRPAEDVLDFVTRHDTDLLVMGAKRKPSLNRTVLGTTTEELTRHARCAVLTVPDPERHS